MNKLLTVVLASTFILGPASVFAADAATKPELTKEERMEMRNRADKLTAERATTPAPAKTSVEPATKAKKHTNKTKKVSGAAVKYTQPKT